MTKHLLLALFCFALHPLALFAQGTIRGYVRYEQTGESLPFATIIDINTQEGTISNSHGFFSLTVNSAHPVIVVSFVGFEQDTFSLSLQKDTSLTLKLNSSQSLGEVNVLASRSTKLHELQPGSYQIPMARIRNTAQIFGEADVLKSIRQLPGVSAGSERSSNFYVRGGGADQNLLLLDDVPIYNAGHLYGIFSIFNTDALKAANFMKSGISAQYGGRLSSVLDLRLKEGDQNAGHGKFSVGLASSKLFLEGPIKRLKATYIVSVRRSYADMLLLPVQYQSNRKEYKTFKEGFNFHDLIAKLSFSLGPKDKLFLSTYAGQDKVYSNREARNEIKQNDQYLKWGNQTAVARWSHIWSAGTFSNIMLSYTNYGTSIFSASLRHDTAATTLSPVYQNTNSAFSMGLNDISAKAEFTTRLTGVLSAEYGLVFTERLFNQGESRFEQITDPVTKERKTSLTELGKTFVEEGAAYAQISLKNQSWHCEAGLRQSLYIYGNKSYSHTEPRLMVAYRPTGNLQLRSAFEAMSQNLHLLVGEDDNLPTDRWVPATDSFPPSFSESFSIGVAYKDAFTLSIDAFYKKMDNLISYTTNYGFDPANVNWQDRMATERGEAAGLEFALQYSLPKIDIWAAYTLSKSKRKPCDRRINEGRAYSFKYDRTHDLNVALNFKLTKRLSMSATWCYASGMYATMPTQLMGNRLIYGKKNEYKLPDYHRLDLGLSLFKQKKKGSATWQFGVYNAYNRANIFYISVDTGNQGPPRFTQHRLFPVFPYVNYVYEF